ncbi:DUF6602 domain-containing protein [Caminibacter pacificus]
MPFSPEKFQKSINEELKIINNRVKDLIDIEGNHHAEDGAYREAILRNVIRRFLPNNISIGTGFIIAEKRGEFKRTSQIDIIIYDNTYPLLFQEGDFIITTPKNVKAIIEVKTSIKNSSYENDNNGIFNIINKAKKNYEIIKKYNKKIFNGVFSFYYNDSLIDKRNGNLSRVVEEALKTSEGKVNHIVLGEKIFIKYWENQSNRIINKECDSNNFFNIYELNNLAFSYFISNVIDFVVDKNMEDRFWFMFPKKSKHGKEDFKISQLCL